MNIKGRKIDALANDIILYGVKLFEERFPNGTDEEFDFLYSCIHKRTGDALYGWQQEKFLLDK